MLEPSKNQLSKLNSRLNTDKVEPLPVEEKKEQKQGSSGLDSINKRRSRSLEEVNRWMPSKLGVFNKAFEGKSLRSAINAKCLDCTCCQSKEIKLCPVTECPLWEVRPYQV